MELENFITENIEETGDAAVENWIPVITWQTIKYLGEGGGDKVVDFSVLLLRDALLRRKSCRFGVEKKSFKKKKVSAPG